MSFVPKLIIVDLAALILLFLALYLLKNVFRIVRGGFSIRKKTFDGEGCKMRIVDIIYLSGSKCSRRGLVTEGGYQGAVPLGKKHRKTLVYAAFCSDFLSLSGEENIKSPLTLGGGAGAVPFYTYHRYNAVSDVIEINKECIKIAKKYFTRGADINYICADALDGAKKLLGEGKRYQFIFCDLFVGPSPAKVVFEKELMTTLSALAGSDGIFVMNGTNQDVRSMNTVLANAESAFGQTALFMCRNSLVLCGTNRTDIELIKTGNKRNGMFPVYPKTPFHVG